MAQTYIADVPDGTTNILQDNINGRNNENTLRSNFSGTAFPDTPVAGQHCYRTDTGIEYIYDGTAWIEVAATNTLGLDVAAAKGTLSNLSSRLNVSINPDGTLKDPTTANVDEFKVSNVTPTYVDATTFSVPDDLTGIFTAGRLLKITDGAETKYLLVVSSSYDTVTNVVVDGTITASISAVDYSLLQKQLENIPTQINTDKSNKMASTEFVHDVFGEFYPIGVTPTYVDTDTFTAAGDLTAIFTKGRVLKITDTGGTFNAICATSAYDSGTELTTVTVAGDTIDSGLSAVLYAVQQVTGQIWESGSNSNGTYIKWADGTMMTYRSMDLTFAGAVMASGAVDIAALYKDMNFIVSATPRSTITGSGACCAVFKANPYTEGSVTVEAAELQNMARTGIATVNITTIGRWF
jgi:hypothetical protein